MAARFKIIVLTKTADDINVLFWADVPTARQPFYAALWGSTKSSAWSQALAADNTALQNGSVVETAFVQRTPPGSTIASVEAALQTAWTSYQAFINSNNPWSFVNST